MLKNYYYADCDNSKPMAAVGEPCEQRSFACKKKSYDDDDDDSEYVNDYDDDYADDKYDDDFDKDFDDDDLDIDIDKFVGDLDGMLDEDGNFIDDDDDTLVFVGTVIVKYNGKLTDTITIPAEATAISST